MAKIETTHRTINLGSIHTIPLGQGRCYIVEEQEIAVFRQRDGHLFATQNRCPHGRGPLSDGLIGARKVICPLHAHKFNLETGAGTEPGECLNTYQVIEANGDILLRVDVTGFPSDTRVAARLG